jgi:CRISPR-associated protein Csx10
MIEWLLQVKAISPLALHAERGPAQFARTLLYIPGSSLRGALADVYLKTGTQDTDFQRLFLADVCLFPDLYPSDGIGESAPLPATARACKRFKLKHPESLSDALLPLRFLSDDARKSWESCPNAACKSKNVRDRIEGFRVENDTQRVIKPHTRTVAGTSILRATQTAASGQLFSHTVVEEGARFSGRIRMADETLANKLRDLLRKAPLRVGYGRTRGMGLLEIEDLDESPPARLPDLPERLDKFNAVIGQIESATGRYAALTLESDVLLRDELLRPVTTIEDGSALGLKGAALERAFVVPALAHGWNAALGLPKPDTPGLGRGSVFLFKLNDVTAEAQLAAMETDGIGERRAEGFGRVRVCDPFHYKVFEGGQ